MTYDRTQIGHDLRTDHETEQYAHELESAVRALNRAIGRPQGLTGPATIHTVLEAVHTAASGFDQLLLHLERFLTRQHTDGHLVHDHGAGLDEALDAFSRAVLHARHQGAACSEAAKQARAAIEHVHGRSLPPATGTPSACDVLAEPAPAPLTRPTQLQEGRLTGRRPRTRWFGGPRKGA